MSELLPCPFCGSIPVLIEGQFGDWFVTCNSLRTCNVLPMTILIEDYDGKHPGQNTRERAIKNWNKRA